jgi:hypothetical protein
MNCLQTFLVGPQVNSLCRLDWFLNWELRITAVVFNLPALGVLLLCSSFSEDVKSTRKEHGEPGRRENAKHDTARALARVSFARLSFGIYLIYSEITWSYKNSEQPWLMRSGSSILVVLYRKDEGQALQASRKCFHRSLCICMRVMASSCPRSRSRQVLGSSLSPSQPSLAVVPPPVSSYLS